MSARKEYRHGSYKAIFNQFQELYPSIQDKVSGYTPFHWNNRRRSILIEFEGIRERVLFEVNTLNPERTWTGYRALLVPGKKEAKDDNGADKGVCE